ncbi:MAG TPA: YhdP family protein [Burkholderiales bacterium]|nr:YhdP family protein [Burkholderiales bacterium]
MSLAATLRWLKSGSAWTSRALLWSVIAVVLVCASVVLSLRYWLLPNVDAYRDDIAAAVSRAANLRITIGRISGDWDGMRPHLKLENVSVHDREGHKALELARVDSTLAWRSLATLRLHFHALDIYRPYLGIRRDTEGVLSVAGIRLETEHRDRAGFTDWLLQQPDVEIHDAAVVWTDELRGAPPLELTGVALQLVNRGSRHRFGFRARPPEALAAPIELRGDVRGESIELISRWNGRLFLQLDRVDLGAWGPWLDLPVEVTRGAGALRTWLTFGRDALSEVVADVKLASVKARLREDLPQLELDALAGRLAWKEIPDGFEFVAGKLGFSGGGAVLPPADIRLHVATDKDGVQRGEAHADALDLAPLTMIADRLPFDDALRAELVAAAPRGKLHDVALRWTGAWPEPQTFSARGRFESLAVNRWRSAPGFTGLSGQVDGTEKGGTLRVTGESAVLDMPQVFAGALKLDTLTGQLAWTRSAAGYEVRLDNVSFANPDAAGRVLGTYRSAPQPRGEIDLTGQLTRADARGVAKYIPITVMKGSRPWFERAFVAGQSNDVRFRVKGRLDEFPFPDEKRGTFQVTAKVTGGTLDYAERWPRIEGIEGDLAFRGSRMEFLARRGTINGVKLSKVQGEIPDLKARPEMLTVSGEAEGTTPEFLAFIAKTPVADMIDHHTDGIQAQGNGRLTLTLTLPLGQLASSNVAGSYLLLNNNVIIERDVPALEAVNGRIEFTESSVRTTGLTGTFLGGPIRVSGTTHRDSVMRATLEGRINADNVRKAGGPAWMQHLRGSTDWRGALTLRKKVPELVLESSLQGIASNLPAPLAKSAAEAMPLRIDRRVTAPQQDRILVNYGNLVKAELVRRIGAGGTVVERGVVRLGAGEAGEPDRPGVWVRGALGKVDLDEWLAFSRSATGDGGSTFAGADVKFGEAQFLGRAFHDLGVVMSPQTGATQLTLTGREIEGVASWRGEGRGRLNARLKKLVLGSADTKAAAAAKPEPAKPAEFPALDVVVESFQHGEKQLGRLELNAVPQDRNWRIERLRIANPDTVLVADGVWQGWRTEPRTQLNVRMDVTDIGRGLARWALPAGVRRGTAKIEGQLDWNGSPHDLDYASLGGLLTIQAEKGQFVKLEPGIAKLLGIVSLQSLPRRISLDFRDVFSEGFAFDTIAGSLKIERGVATTDNFRIQGPSARVMMAGDVDFARETQKLKVRVTPHIAESVSIAGALIGGPVVGAAAFLAQKILKDPLEHIVSFEYNVTGSWSDPQVAKTARAPMALQEGSP